MGFKWFQYVSRFGGRQWITQTFRLFRGFSVKTLGCTHEDHRDIWGCPARHGATPSHPPFRSMGTFPVNVHLFRIFHEPFSMNHPANLGTPMAMETPRFGSFGSSIYETWTSCRWGFLWESLIFSPGGGVGDGSRLPVEFDDFHGHVRSQSVCHYQRGYELSRCLENIRLWKCPPFYQPFHWDLRCLLRCLLHSTQRPRFLRTLPPTWWKRLGLLTLLGLVMETISGLPKMISHC